MTGLTLLLALMIAPGLGGGSVALSQQTAAAASSKRLAARSVYENSAEHQTQARDVKNHSSEKRFSRGDPTQEAAARRAKLLFLIMMSLGQYRTPVH